MQLFGAFFGLCLVLIQLGLRPLAPRAGEGILILRGGLARFERLRARIYPLSRALAWGLALWLARDFAGHGQEWIFLQSGGRAGFAYLGLDAALWTRFLPLWMPFLFGLWRFSLALGFLVAATGILRALPIIAANNSAPPALSRHLWRVGALLLLLRGVLYGYQLLDLPRGAALSSGDVCVLAPLFGAGAIWCAVSSLDFARRALLAGRLRASRRPQRAPIKATRAAFGFFGALFLPALLGVLSWPLRAILPETVALGRERERATRAAWHLLAPETALPQPNRGAPIERVWPAWDEAALLASRPPAAFREGRLLSWKSATLGSQNGQWRALLVGDSAGAMTPASSRAAYKETALALETFDLEAGDADALKGRRLPIINAFFGLQGEALFGTEGGVPFQSPIAKLAWAWRERDPLLLADADTSSHLLTRRGARQRAQMLAPFLTPLGEPRLSLEGGKPVWTLDLCALSPNFPGAMRGQNGAWADINSASLPLQMRLDARSGAVIFAAAPQGRDAVIDAWRAAYPALKSLNEAQSTDAGGDLGFAQMEISAAMRGQETAFYGPTRALNARGLESWQVVAAGQSSFEVLEGAAPRPTLQRANGDLGARLSAIDAAIAKNRAASGQSGDEVGAASKPMADTLGTVRLGAPVVWRDERAPGGFWIGRAFFAAPRAVAGAASGAATSPVLAPHGAILWRVALTGIAPDAPVGVGKSAQAALLSFALLNLPAKASAPAIGAAPLNSKAPFPGAPKGEATGQLAKQTPLEVAALQTHRALQEAIKRSDWAAFGTLNARQNAILERLVAQRQNAASSQVQPKNR